MNGNWLLLLHQIPPKPPYSRAKILRRLSQAGALPLKNSAYLLPYGEDTLEDFQWICGEITDVGGKAWLFRTEAVAGISSDQIEESFRALRSEDYKILIEEARTELNSISAGQPDAMAGHVRLARRAEELRRIDFFESPGRTNLEKVMNEIETKLKARSAGESVPEPGDLQPGRIWVTRKGVKVDRIGSAWLVRRFLDSQAVFRFVNPDDYSWEGNEIRFDMFDGEFTHRGSLCTFEVLISTHNLNDPALRLVAEIVHDIDLKDNRYQHPETAGIARMLDGLYRLVPEDEKRIERGSMIFDSLYQAFAE